MKIAFFHELHFGGARRVVAEYAKVFSKDHEISLYYVDQEKEKEIENIFANAFHYQFTPVIYKGNNIKAKIYKDFVETFKLYRLHKKIATEIDKQHFDFVFVHPSQFTHAPFILRFLKTPIVYFCQEPLRTVYDPTVSISPDLSVFKRKYEEMSRAFKKKIDTVNIKKANIVLANCKYTRGNIRKAYGINSYVCYLGVDPSLFKPLKLEKKYDVLFVGADIWMEGYDTLQEINKAYGGTLKIHVVKSESGEYISDSNLAKEYNKAKLVVVLGRFDPFSMIPLESMACEVCPVVVNEGGPIEAIENNIDGYILERNPNIFAEKIRNLLQNDEKRKIMGKTGRKHILSFWNWEKSSERLFTILEESRGETGAIK